MSCKRSNAFGPLGGSGLQIEEIRGRSASVGAEFGDSGEGSGEGASRCSTELERLGESVSSHVKGC